MFNRGGSVPTYQYACTECDHAFEQFQSFSDDALSVCPRCEGRLRKVYNAVGVVFKGSGFYRNDSRADAKANGSGTSGSATESGTTKTADSGSSDSGTSDKKTDTKSDKKSETTSATKSAKTSGTSSSAA
jgi:putative FmdB family regulatory protein